MDSLALIEQARRHGFELWVNAGQLRVRGPRSRTDLVEQLRQHRDEAVAMLATELAWSDDELRKIRDAGLTPTDTPPLVRDAKAVFGAEAELVSLETRDGPESDVSEAVEHVQPEDAERTVEMGAITDVSRR